jgi:hypothetical protein
LAWGLLLLYRRLPEEEAHGNSMTQKSKGLALSIIFALLGAPLADGGAKTGKSRQTSVESARSGSAVLWREPTDIGSRNLFYGPGGEEHQPKGPFTFVEEDLNGSNPKYVVRDQNKVKWTVKLGNEARPETVASRLVWAVGYFTNEDYFLQDIQVAEMPAHLKRGGNQIGPGGSMHAVRLKRHLGDEKKIENWKWSDDSVGGSRELNGLKVMMALINNWDLKDTNNALYGGKDAAEQTYIVSDLGASFGSTGPVFPYSHSKGNLSAYVHSGFIGKVAPEYVDFRTPSHPALIYVFGLPAFMRRVRLDDTVHHIPRADARWIGQLLSGLSPDQIRDAFRAAGYAPKQVDAFTSVVQARIQELNRL